MILEADTLKPIKKFLSGRQSSFLYKLQPVDSDNFWICSSNGAFKIEDAQGDFLSSKNLILPEQRVSDMLIDREGNYWFSTLQNGIFVIPSLEILTYSSSNFPALETPNLTKLYALTDNKLLIGSHNGRVMQLDPLKNELRYIFDAVLPPYRAVKNFLETEDMIFVSRNSNFVHHKKTSIEKRVAVGDSRAVWIIADSLFAVSPNNFVKFYPVKKSLNYGTEFDSTVLLANVGGWSMTYDSSFSALWVALSAGLHYYKDGKLNAVLHENDPVYAGYSTYSEGILWVSTLNKGVYGYENGILKYIFDESNGLKSNSAKAIAAKGDFVIISAGNYLHRINYRDGKFDTFTKNLGIYAKDIEDIKIMNDHIYLATHKGLISIPLRYKSHNAVSPNIAIERTLLANIDISRENLLKLPYRHGQLSVHFNATAFRSKGQFYYEYRLVGLDSNWVKQQSENSFVNLSAIPPGKYRFEVRAVNESGVKSKIAALDLSVMSPAWQQWWFYFLMAAFFTGIVFLFYSWRLKSIEQKLQMEKALGASQLTALKAQMNPHFMYNALNSIQDLILTNDFRNANRYLNKFSSLMRLILGASDSDEILLEEELNILNLYLELEKLRFGDDFSFEIEIENELKKREILIASMIIQPFVENAVKHGLLHKKGDKKLNISFEKYNSKLIRCVIEDNGIGRKRASEIKERAAKQHQSFATKATEKRLEILNKSYKTYKIGLEIIDIYENAKAEGTRVILFIPFKEKDSL